MRTLAHDDVGTFFGGAGRDGFSRLLNHNQISREIEELQAGARKSGASSRCFSLFFSSRGSDATSSFIVPHALVSLVTEALIIAQPRSRLLQQRAARTSFPGAQLIEEFHPNVSATRGRWITIEL